MNLPIKTYDVSVILTSWNHNHGDCSESLETTGELLVLYWRHLPSQTKRLKIQQWLQVLHSTRYSFSQSNCNHYAETTKLPELSSSIKKLMEMELDKVEKQCQRSTSCYGPEFSVLKNTETSRNDLPTITSNPKGRCGHRFWRFPRELTLCPGLQRCSNRQATLESKRGPWLPATAVIRTEECLHRSSHLRSFSLRARANRASTN